MALRPDLVDLSQQPSDLEEKLVGVGGRDPRVHASPEYGRRGIDAIVRKVSERNGGILRELGIEPPEPPEISTAILRSGNSIVRPNPSASPAKRRAITVIRLFAGYCRMNVKSKRMADAASLLSAWIHLHTD